MLESQRHAFILDLLAEKRFVTLQDLRAELDVSEATVRRDLNHLALEGMLNRVHGGAVLSEASTPLLPQRYLEGYSFQTALERHATEKREIAKAAASLCEPGETIIINGGSSTFMMGEFLRDQELRIITNSFALAGALLEQGKNQVSIPGGRLYRRQSLILSDFEDDGLKHYRASKMFMGTPAISERGVMESDEILVRAEQKLMRCADKLIVLADASKLHASSSFLLCDLGRVSTLITDRQADRKQLEFFRERGVQVIVANQRQAVANH